MLVLQTGSVFVLLSMMMADTATTPERETSKKQNSEKVPSEMSLSDTDMPIAGSGGGGDGRGGGGHQQLQQSDQPSAAASGDD